MLNNEGQAASATLMFGPLAAANTAAASSTWYAVGAFDGDLVLIQQLGGVAIGNVTGSFDTAFSAAGASAASANFNEGAFVVGTSNNVQVRTLRANSTGGFIRYRPNLSAGPATISVTMLARKRQVGY